MDDERWKILLVDDSTLTRTVVAAQLRREPCVECVRTAGDGLQALESLGEFTPDVMITDLEMPVMGGVECILALRQFADPPPTVVMSSVESDSPLARAAQAAGAAGYVCKPRLGARDDVQRAHRELMQSLECSCGRGQQAG